MVSPVLLLAASEALLFLVPSWRDGYHPQGRIQRDLALWSDLLNTFQPGRWGLPGVNRQKDLPDQPDPGTHRILCIGSSTTVALGCLEPGKYGHPAQLQALLDEAGGPTKYEVLNMSEAGLHLSVLRAILEQALPRKKPRLVVLYFGNNGDTPRSRAYVDRVVSRMRQRPGPSSDARIWALISTGLDADWAIPVTQALSSLRTFWALGDARRALARFSSPDGSEVPFYKQTTEEERQALEETAGALVKLCVDHGVKLLLIPEVPSPRTPGEMPPRLDNIKQVREIFSRLAARHSARGVRYVPIDHHFPDALKKLYFVDGIHLTCQGYTYLAGIIAATLKLQGLVPVKQ